MSPLFTSHHTSHYIILHYITSHITLHHITLHHITHPITSYYITSNHTSRNIISYQITSDHITSHLNNSFLQLNCYLGCCCVCRWVPLGPAGQSHAREGPSKLRDGGLSCQRVLCCIVSGWGECSWMVRVWKLVDWSIDPGIKSWEFAWQDHTVVMMVLSTLREAVKCPY